MKIAQDKKPTLSQGNSASGWAPKDCDAFVARLKVDPDFARCSGIYDEIRLTAIDYLSRLKEIAVAGSPTTIRVTRADQFRVQNPEFGFWWDWIQAGRGWQVADTLVKAWSGGKLTCGCELSPCQFEITKV